MSNCFICLEDLDDNVYYLSSCNHGYHTRCLVDWFYTNKTTFCPCCMNEMNEFDIHTNEPVDFACASRCARKKNAPIKLSRLYTKYKDFCLRHKQNAMEIRLFNTEHGVEFHPLQKKIRGLRRNKNKLQRRIRLIKRRMCVVNVYPESINE